MRGKQFYKRWFFHRSQHVVDDEHHVEGVRYVGPALGPRHPGSVDLIRASEAQHLVDDEHHVEGVGAAIVVNIGGG